MKKVEKLDIRFKPLPPVGPRVGMKWTHARISDFLNRYGGLLYRGYIPPMAVINSFLKSGEHDAGIHA